MIQRLIPYIKWAALLVILTELLLVWVGEVSLTDAIVVVLILEGLLFIFVILGAWQIRHVYRSRLNTSPDRFTAAMQAVETVMPKPLGKLIALELTMQRATLLFAMRRRDIPPSCSAVSYHRALSGILWAMLAIALVELFVVHLAVPWPTARVTLLVISMIGLWWFFAFFASLVVYPTTLCGGNLRIRFSSMVDVTVPVAGVERARVHQQSLAQRHIAMFHDDSLHVEVYGSTNVTAQLREPVLVSLPNKGKQVVSKVHLWADEPERLVRLLAETTSEQ
ncbi:MULTISPECIES: hypothetical protein [Streptomyces]|uniref:hypothetical protein n=1 Tax=Streptomyces TaxID=1883 RepID=UPI00224964A4|nr:hypothetical protein [Streptomyces sp. JHD 1]MCX2970803.1 hypothetical protein [Streptomyces sp. JHD 1]